MENFTIKTPNASFTTNLLKKLASKIKAKKTPIKSFMGLFTLLLTFFLGANASAQTTYNTKTIDGNTADWNANELVYTNASSNQVYVSWDATYIYVRFAGGYADTDRLNIGIDVAPGTNDNGTSSTGAFSGATFSGYLTPDYIIQSTATTSLKVYPRSTTTWGASTDISSTNIWRSSAVSEIRIPRSNVGLSTTTIPFGMYFWLSNSSDTNYATFGGDNPVAGLQRTAVVWANSGSGVTVNTAMNFDYNSAETRTLGSTSALPNIRNLYINANTATTPATALTVSGNVLIGAGGLSLSTTLGGDLYVGGNFTNNGTFTHNSRAAYLNGTSVTAQTISGTLNGTTTTNCFPYLFVYNSNGGATLGTATNVTTNLTVTANAKLNLSSFALTANSLTLETGSTSGATISSSTGTLTLGGDVTVNSTSGGNGAVISCPVALTNLATRTFTINDDTSAVNDLSITGAISTSGALTKAGTGTLILSGVNTYSGATAVNAGTLKLGSTTAFGTSSVTVSSGAVVDLNGFTLSTARPMTLNGTGLTSTPAGALTNTGGNASYSGSIAIGGASGATITATTSGTLTCTGGITGAFPLILDGSGSGTVSTTAIATSSGAVTKNGSGTWTFSIANSYTGLTTVNAGTLLYGVNNALSSGAVTVSGGTLDMSTFTDTVGAVTLTSGTITGTTGVLTGTSYALQGGTVSAILAGAVAMNKTTSGTVILSGNNTNTGTTTISAGTLQISAAQRIADTSNMVLIGGTFSTGASTGFAETVGTLQLNATSTIALGSGSHTLTFSASNGTAWTAGQTLNITGWSGTAGTVGIAGRIFVGSASTGLTAAQLAQISFSGFSPSTAIILSTGEIVPKVTQFYVATTGNDSNLGTTSGSPKATIASVLSSYSLGTGDVINVAAGTYSETAIVVGSDDAGFTIQGAALSGGVPTTIYSSTNISRWLYIGNGNNGTTVLNNTNITINNITVQNYKATGSGLGGGAIYIEKGATGTAISNCVFNNCTNSLSSTEYGGAIMSNDYFTVTNSVFKNCTSDQGGGAVALWTGPTGGTYTSTLPSLISKCTFYSNTCTSYDGSAVFNGKGLTTGGAAVQLNVFNSLFYSNSAGSNNGCIVSNNGSVINMMNCTVTKNSSTGGTGGLYSASSKVLATNCIIYGNTGGITQKDFNCASSTDMYINTCLYQFGGSASITGTNVTTLAPGFTNTSTNDYTIVSGSAGINKGTFSSTLNSITTASPGDDILSATRTGYPDIGCYESQDCTVVPSTSFVASSITSSTMTLTWTRGTGTGVMVVARPTAAAATDPTNGITYTANAAYGTSGTAIGSGFVVYNSTSNTVNITGLTANTAYTFDIYEYNTSSSPLTCTSYYGSADKLTGVATTLCVAPSTPSSAITFANVNANSMKISWTIGNGSNHVVRIKAVSAPTGLVNGTAPATASTTYASDGILYNSTGNSVTVTGLSASTVYYVSVTESNCTGTGIIYSAAVTSNTTTPSGNTFYSITSTANTDATVPGNWNTATDGSSGVFAVASNFSSATPPNTFIIQNGHQYQVKAAWTGVSGNTVTVNSGGALDFAAQTVSGFSGISISGTGVSSSGALYNTASSPTCSIPITLSGPATISSSTGGSLTLSGAIVNSGNTLTLNGTTTLALSGLISGNGGLTKAGSGTAILSNASSSYTGTTSIDAGTLRVITNAVTPSAISPLGLNASLNLNGGALETAVAFSRPISVTANGSRIDAYTSAQTVSGGITATGAYTLSLGGTTVTSLAGQALTLSGIIGNGSGTLSLTKVLTSSVTLSGANTYSGTTTLGASAGTLNINNATALGTGTFAITGSGSTINTIAGGITLTNNNPITVGGDFTFTGTGNLNLGAGTFTLTANSSATVSANTLTIGSDPVGNFMLIKSPKSPGTLTVTPLKPSLASWVLNASNAGSVNTTVTPDLSVQGPNFSLTTSAAGTSVSTASVSAIATANNYFKFSYKPASNVSITQIQFDYLLGAANTHTLALYYVNNGGTLTQLNANVTLSNTAANVMLADFAGNPITVTSGTTIEFRIYAAFTTTATTVKLANFNILGTTQPAFTVGTLSAFSSCAGTASTNQSFTVSGTNMNNNVVVTAPTGYEVSLLTGGIYTSSVTITASGTLTATSVFVRLSNTATGSPSGTITCTSVGASSQNVSVSGTVTPLPTTATNGSAQTICPISSATLSGNTPTVGTGAWSVLSGPNTTTSQFSSLSDPAATFTPAGGSGIYVVRWTISNGSCTASTADATITANANYLDFVNLQYPSTGSVCAGSSFTAYGQVYEPGITPGSGLQGAGIIAQFGYSTTNTNPNTWTNWSDASFNAAGGGVNNDEYMYVFTPATSGTYYYTYRYKLSTCSAWQYGGYNTGTWDGSTNVSGVLTVTAVPTMTLSYVDDVPVTATSFSIPYSAATGSPDKYSLTTAANGGTSIAMTGFTPVSNATLSTSPIVVTIPASAASEYGFYLTVTNSTTGCSSVYPFQFHVTSVNHGTIGYDQTICSGSSAATITNLTLGTSSSGDPITYTWDKSTTSINTGYSAISGATSSSYSPGVLTQTTYFKRVAHDVGVSLDITSDSDPITITVNATSVGGAVTTGKTQTICTGTSPSDIAITGYTGSVVRWEKSTTSDFAIPSTINSTATTLTTATIGTLSTTTYFRAVVQSGVCSIAYTSDYATVTVSPASVGGAVTTGKTQTICTGASPADLAITGYTGSVVRWEKATNSSFTSPTTISSTSATLTTATIGTLSATTYFRAVVQSGVCSIAYSSDYATVSVTSNNTAGSASSSPTVCISTAITSITHTTTGATGISNSGVSGANGLPTGVSASWSSNTVTISGTPTASGVFNYSIPLTGGCGSITATGTITVNAASVGGTATATAPIICSGTSTTLTISGNTGSTILWQQTASADDTGWATVTGGSGSTTSTYTTPNLTATTYYRALVSNGVCSSTNSTTASVTMEVVAANTSSQTICSGVANLSASVPSSNTTGAWTIVSGPNTSTSQFSNTALPSASFTPTTAGSYVIRWTISGGTCGTSYADATIVVGAGSSTTWNGTAWSNGAPTSTSTAYITGNYSSTTNGGSITACTLTVSNNAVVNIASANDIILNGVLTVGTGSSVTIENNASLVQSANVTNVGKIIVKHNSSALFRLDYTLWSSPVASQNLVLFSPSTSVSPSRFYTYNTSTDLYDPITPPSASTFNTAQGYLIRMPNTWVAVGAGSAAAWTGTFTGVPNNGNISVTMSNAGQGYNAVGNPYPSALNFANFVYANSANIEGTVYFWRKTNNSANPVSYSTCTTVGCTVNNGHTYTHPELISVGQGFIVQAKAGHTTLNFTNGMRTSDNINQFFRTSVVNRFWLELSNTANASFGKKLIAYIPDATLGYDNGLDGLFLNDTKTALLSVADNHDLVIQARPEFTATDVVPLVLKADVADTYTITLQEVEGIFNGSQTIFLKDKLTNTSHDFSTGAYTFTTEAGRFDSRFEIVYQNPLAVQQPTFNGASVVVYKQNNELIINSGNTTMANVKVFDIRGRLLMEKNNINATQTKFYTGTTNEVLLVQITSDAMGTVTKKVIN